MALEWEGGTIGPDVEVSVFDECEVHENCTVEIWKNSVTGEISIGWRENEGDGNVSCDSDK